ncbi:nitrite reductase (NAD(P)H), partial [Xanthomonas citri pv. citri]|nr:nitrite reductase (NAD(P)H) [Xanthomonas citri pv. citri]
DDAPVCSCNNVSAGRIRAAVTEENAGTLADIKACTKAGTSCGSCLPIVKKVFESQQELAGIIVRKALCEHMPMSRSELFNAVKVARLT